MSYIRYKRERRKINWSGIHGPKTCLRDIEHRGTETLVRYANENNFTCETDYTRHSHEFEVKSGMLILPKPAAMSSEEWEKAEIEAMNEVVGLYGKTWHFWQIDKGDKLPLGESSFRNGLRQIILLTSL